MKKKQKMMKKRKH